MSRKRKTPESTSPLDPLDKPPTTTSPKPTTFASSSEPVVVKPATTTEPATAAPLATAPPTNWIPSRKWIARSIIAAGGIVTMWLTTGSWDLEESLATVTAVVAAATSYFLPNTVEDVTAN